MCKNGIRYGQNENENALPGSRWWLQKSGNTPVHKAQHFHFSHPLVTKRKEVKHYLHVQIFVSTIMFSGLHQYNRTETREPVPDSSSAYSL